MPEFETEFKDAVRLFQDSLGAPIARIQAEHNCKAAEKASADVALELQSVRSASVSWFESYGDEQRVHSERNPQ